jgi:hypothetical protein
MYSRGSPIKVWFKRQRRRVQGARKWPARDWALPFETLLWLVIARWHLRATSFNRIIASLSRVPETPAGIDVAAVRRALRVGRMVTRLARMMPFNARCLVQAIATHAMLFRRGLPTVVHFGVEQGKALRTVPGEFAAHAWVTLAGQPVVGGTQLEHTEIARFGLDVSSAVLLQEGCKPKGT